MPSGNIAIQAIMQGVDAFKKETAAIETSVNRATIAAVRENQRILKVAVRRNLRGKPRWNQRGKSRIYEQNTKFPNLPHHAPRDGMPGRFTGALYGGVGSGRPKPGINGDIVGGVGVGGKVNNLKKGRLELKFPYFRPAVEVTEPKMAEAYVKGWDRAVNRMGGLY